MAWRGGRWSAIPRAAAKRVLDCVAPWYPKEAVCKAKGAPAGGSMKSAERERILLWMIGTLSVAVVATSIALGWW